MRTEAERLDEVGRGADATRDNECHVLPPLLVEVSSGASESENRGDGDVVPKNQRRCSRGTASSIQNNVVGTGFQRKLNVALDVLCGHLEPDGNATGQLSHPSGKPSVVSWGGELGEGWGRNRVLPFLQLSNLGNLSLDLVAGQMAPVPVFAPCPALK